MINRFSTIIWTVLTVVLIGCSPAGATNALIPTQNDVLEQELQIVSATPTKKDVLITPTPIQKDVVELELPAATVTPNPSEPPRDDPVISNPSLQNLVDQAKADLAERLSVPIEEIDLVEAREVVWPDSSLGCPQPGMKYLQVLEDGTLIILKFNGSAYEYHYGSSRGLFLCEQVYKDPYKPTPIDITKLTPSTLDKDNSLPTTPDNSIPPGENQ